MIFWGILLIVIIGFSVGFYFYTSQNVTGLEVPAVIILNLLALDNFVESRIENKKWSILSKDVSSTDSGDNVANIPKKEAWVKTNSKVFKGLVYCLAGGVAVAPYEDEFGGWIYLIGLIIFGLGFIIDSVTAEFVISKIWKSYTDDK